MKAMKKALALGLALAMVVTAVPVTSAQAATTGVPKSKTYAAGKSYTLKLTTSSTWKSVSTKWSTSNKSVASLSNTKTKSVTVKAVKKGTATVTAKVTFKKSNKKYTKTYKCNVTVKNPGVRMNAEATVVLGQKASVKSPKAWPSTATVTYTSDNTDVATVDAKTGDVTGVKAGEANIKATLVCGTITKTASTKVTVKPYDFQSVTQTKADELKVVIAGDTKSVAASSITITNMSNNASYPVKSYDAEKGLVTTYQGMTDGKEYKVVIGGTEKTFVATDGVVADVDLESNTVVVGKETKVKVQTKDARGVILNTVEYGDNNNAVTITNTNISAGGYITTEGLYLEKVGDIATFDVVYHSGKWDNTTGTEIGNVVKNGLTVTAVDAAAIDGWAVKVGDKDKTFGTVKETKLAVNDTDKAAYIQMTDTAKNTSTDISNFTVESSDMDTLVVTQIEDKNKDGMVELVPNKVGTAYLIIKDKNTQAVVKTLPISIVAERKAVSLSLNKTSVSLTAGIDGYEDKTDVAVTVKDQYGEDVKKVNEDVTVVPADNASGIASAVVDTESYRKVTVAAVGVGDTTVTVKYAGGTVELTKKFAVKVSTAPAEGSIGFTVDASETRVDAIIKGDTADDTKITVNAFATKGGVKSDWINTFADNALTEVTLAKGGTTYKIDATSSSAIAIKPIVPTDISVLSITSGGSIEIKVNDVSSGWKLEAGAYTLTVKAKIGGNDKTVTKTIVVTDTQPKVTVTRVKTSANSVTECFEVFYDGKKQESPEVKFYNAKGVDVTGDTNAVSVSYAIVTVTLENGNKVAQRVNIGQTVTVG